MFSGTRDKALQPITKLDIEPVRKTVPESHRPYHKNFWVAENARSAITLGASRKQNLSIFFAIRNEDKKRKQ